MTQPEQKRSYQKELGRLIEGLQREGRVPKLLLYSCCAPCSSCVLEYLSQYSDVIVYYYDPNIFPEARYEVRVKERKHLIWEMTAAKPARSPTGSCKPEEFFSIARGHKRDPEGGERCHHCCELRLNRAAREAMPGNFNLFTIALSISPLKSAQWLSDVGYKLASQYGIPCLVSDFKKKNDYKHSVGLSALYEFYRRGHCGCVYSRIEA